MQLFTDGLVVVPRKIKGEKLKNGRAGRTRTGWTRHRDSCSHALRSQMRQPCPETPYPDTADCPYCHPEGHRTLVAERDGGFHASCSDCDITWDAKSSNAARDGVLRRHVGAEAHRRLAAGEKVKLLSNRKWDGPADENPVTLHYWDCSRVATFLELTVAPDPLPAGLNMAYCIYCCPNGHHLVVEPVDGGFRGKCDACDLAVTSRSEKQARTSVRALHRHVALAASLATGAEPTDAGTDAARE